MSDHHFTWSFSTTLTFSPYSWRGFASLVVCSFDYYPALPICNPRLSIRNIVVPRYEFSATVLRRTCR